MKQTWHSVLFKWYKWNMSSNRRCNIWLSVCHVKVYCNKWHFGKNVPDLWTLLYIILHKVDVVFKTAQFFKKLDSKYEMWILVLNLQRFSSEFEGYECGLLPSCPALDVRVVVSCSPLRQWCGIWTGCSGGLDEISSLEPCSISCWFWFWQLSLLAQYVTIP